MKELKLRGRATRQKYAPSPPHSMGVKLSGIIPPLILESCCCISCVLLGNSHTLQWPYFFVAIAAECHDECAQGHSSGTDATATAAFGAAAEAAFTSCVPQHASDGRWTESPAAYEKTPRPSRGRRRPLQRGSGGSSDAWACAVVVGGRRRQPKVFLLCHRRRAIDCRAASDF